MIGVNLIEVVFKAVGGKKNKNSVGIIPCQKVIVQQQKMAGDTYSLIAGQGIKGLIFFFVWKKLLPGAVADKHLFAFRFTLAFFNRVVNFVAHITALIRFGIKVMQWFNI